MSKGEATRRTILDRASAVARREGLEGLTIGSLATELGMSKSGLFAHFGSKEELQVQVLQHAADKFVEAAVRPALSAPRGEPRIRALVDGWLGWGTEEGCIFVAAAVELDDRDGPPRERLVQIQRDWLDLLANAARIAIREGHFRADLDAERFAHELYGVMLAYHHARRLLRDPAALARARASFEDILAHAQPG